MANDVERDGRFVLELGADPACLALSRVFNWNQVSPGSNGRHCLRPAAAVKHATVACLVHIQCDGICGMANDVERDGRFVLEPGADPACLALSRVFNWNQVSPGSNGRHCLRPAAAVKHATVAWCTCDGICGMANDVEQETLQGLSSAAWGLLVNGIWG